MSSVLIEFGRFPYRNVRIFEALCECTQYHLFVLLFNDARGSRENPESSLPLSRILGLAESEEFVEELWPIFACKGKISMIYQTYINLQLPKGYSLRAPCTAFNNKSSNGYP